jgi:hypothetical protein
MDNHWICPECEALNSECIACGKNSYNNTGSKLFLDYPTSLDTNRSFFEKIIVLIYYFLIFLSNIILKKYRTRLPILLGLSIFLLFITFINLLI